MFFLMGFHGFWSAYLWEKSPPVCFQPPSPHLDLYPRRNGGGGFVMTRRMIDMFKRDSDVAQLLLGCPVGSAGKYG